MPSFVPQEDPPQLRANTSIAATYCSSVSHGRKPRCFLEWDAQGCLPGNVPQPGGDAWHSGHGRQLAEAQRQASSKGQFEELALLTAEELSRGHSTAATSEVRVLPS